ncbi:MAG: VOC family protein [Myxococcota bacterium]
MHPHISFITLGVQDMSRARAFYEALGFAAGSSSNERVTFFQANGVVLGLYGAAALAEDAGLEPGTTFRTVVSHNCESPAQVDQVMAAAQDAGAQVTQPAVEVFWGGYRGYFRDLDGHMWEVCHNPFIAIDALGGVWMDGPAPAITR